MSTVLVADDKVSMVELLRQTLEAEGFGVVTARNGDEILYVVSGKVRISCDSMTRNNFV